MARIGHEINGPVNLILDLIRQLRRGTLNPAQEHYLKQILVAAGALLQISGTMANGDLEQGVRKTAAIKFAVRDLFTTVAATYRRRVAEKGIKLSIEVAPEVPLYLSGYPIQIEQAVIQLLDNAVRHVREGGRIRISCTLMGIARNDCALRVAVADTGEGIRPELLHDLHQHLSGAGRDFKVWGGRRMGLSLASSLFADMGGQLQVSSGLGIGTVFTCTIHLNCEAEKGRRVGMLTDKRVIVADSDSVTLGLTMDLLDGIAMRARGAARNLDAVAALREAEAAGSGCDVLILDWSDDALSLRELILHIRSRMGLKKTPGIIARSFSGHAFMRALADRAGADAFLSDQALSPLLLDTLILLCAGDESGLRAQYDQRRIFRPGIFKDMRVLLVEDNQVNRQLASDILKEAGIAVTLAPNGREALNIMSRRAGGTFDLVLKDLQMPEMDGFEATWRIRRDSYLGAAHIPVIALTAHRNTDEVETCRQAGMDDHVPKPIDLEVFFQALWRWAPVLRDNSGDMAIFMEALAGLLREDGDEAALAFLERRERLRRYIGEGRLGKLQWLMDKKRWAEAGDFADYLCAALAPEREDAAF
jgi:CheY-like chemotaxis protein